MYDLAGPTPGCSHSVSSETPLALFQRFFQQCVWDLLVTETNRFAIQSLQNWPHARVWSEVGVEEMKAFVGILILMGICKLPRLGLYWTTKHRLIRPGIFELCSRNRFQQIFRFLHVCNTNDQVHECSAVILGLTDFSKLGIF